jgi:hypothetical protein
MENWAVLRRFLPRGWEEQARIAGALQRARGVSGAEALLRTLLIHLSNGCSLAETSVRAKQNGLCTISSVALFKRLRAAEGWLRWLAQQVRGTDLMPSIGAERRLRAVDATIVSEPGSTGTHWRIHYSVNLGHLPKADPVSCRAWLHGKLFVALLVERMIGEANSFSPWGYKLETPSESEFEFMYREICAATLPSQGLVKTLGN